MTKSPISISGLFNRTIATIINVLMIYIILILLLSLGKTLLTMKTMFAGSLSCLNLSHAITDILSFLVMIELFRSFIDYFKARRIRLHSMIDPAIIFIVRELIVQLYTHHQMGHTTLWGFAGLLLCLGIIRSLAVVFSPEDG